MKLLYLNSKNSSNNVFKLDNPIKGEFKLVSFCFTNNIFNVNDTNNKIYMNETGNDLIATLTNGYYDLTDFKTNAQTAMNSQLGGTLTIINDSNTNKFTFTNTNNFYFTFGTNTSNSARKLLGFNAIDGTNNTSQSSDYPIDLNTYKNIFVDISQNNDKNIDGINFFNTSLIINGIGNFSENVRYIPNDNFDQCIKLSQWSKQIEIKIHDANNNDINLNSEYELILKKI